MTEEQLTPTPDEQTNAAPTKSFGAIPLNRPRKVNAGMWGLPELIVVGFALLVVAATVLFFMFSVLPAQASLKTNKTQISDLDKKLTDANNRFGSITTTQGRVEELRRSVEDFQSRVLPARSTGEPALYQQLNGLIMSYGLVNSGGPDYAPLDIADGNQNQTVTQDGKGRSRLISYYPGTFVTVTLEGNYQSLRRFIREIETSSQFVVISSVTLEPSENSEEKVDPTKPPPMVAGSDQPRPVNPTNPSMPMNPPGFDGGGVVNPAGGQIDRGKTRGERVTLRLEMAAYFRRPDFVPQVAAAPASGNSRTE